MLHLKTDSQKDNVTNITKIMVRVLQTSRLSDFIISYLICLDMRLLLLPFIIHFDLSIINSFFFTLLTVYRTEVVMLLWSCYLCNLFINGHTILCVHMCVFAAASFYLAWTLTQPITKYLQDIRDTLQVTRKSNNMYKSLDIGYRTAVKTASCIIFVFLIFWNSRQTYFFYKKCS